MAWIVRLVSIGAEGEEHSADVMRIAKPDDLTDLASLGLTLAEGKRLLAGVQREIVAAQARLHAARSAAAALMCAGSRTTATTRSPRCSARSRSGCPAFAAPDAARPRRGWDGRRTSAQRRSWISCGRSSPP